MFKNLKIQSKISLTAALVFTVTYILVFSIVLSKIYETCKFQAENIAKSTAVSNAKDVAADLSELKFTASEFENTITNNMDAGFKNRDEIIGMQEDILKSDPKIYGVTVAFEPGAFDSNDAKYAGDKKYGADGRFIPYVTRDGDGYHVEAAYSDSTDMTWYNVPKSTRRLYITEPTTYKVDGQNVSMASLVEPILDSQDNFLGVVSFDYQLNTLQNNIKTVKTLNGGAFLISKKGVIIANGVDNQPLMSNVTAENKSAWENVILHTSLGEEVVKYGAFTKDGKRSLLFATPVTLSGTDTNWSLISVIPIENIYAEFYNILFLIIPIALITLILLILIMAVVSRIISKGIKYASEHLSKIAMGDISVNVDPKYLKKKDEVGILCGQMQDITDNLREKALTAEKISNGNIDVEISEKSSKDVLSQSMKKMVAAVRGLIDEAVMLSDAATNGNVEIRGDEGKFDGGFRQIISGVNNTLDAVAEPIKEVRSVAAGIALNDYTKKVEGDYKGVFKDLGDDINRVRDKLLLLQNNMVAISKGNIESLAQVKEVGRLCENDNMTPAILAMMQNIGNLIKEAEKITEHCMNGDVIGAHGNEDLFEGGFKQIIGGFNKTLDSIIAPISDMVDILDAISADDFTHEIKDGYKGDYKKLMDSAQNVTDRLISVQKIASRISVGDISVLERLKAVGKLSENDELIPAFVQMMESINSLINETTKIAKSASEGNLSVRGDAASFKGGYADVISAINDLLGAVEAPVDDVKRVMTSISDSRLSERITNEYKGGFKALADAVNETADGLEDMMNKISDTLKRMASGDISLERLADFDGDFAAISDAMNSILDSLNGLLGDINSMSEQVYTGSSQVSQGSQQLSQGATEQASAVEQLTASVTELSAKTKQNASDAGNASSLVLAVREKAVLGSSSMKDMLEAMTGISEASSNIRKIIKVIDDIAFQTNILALNAAVEAARAGQYGKGFAVVAAEVRSLAAKSAEAAKNTTDLIESSIAKVNSGTKAADKTSKAFEAIDSGVTNVTALVKKISDASNEQATGISQIDTGLKQVSKVISTISATSEESAAASEELSGQADLLKQQVARFTLRNDD